MRKVTKTEEKEMRELRRKGYSYKRIGDRLGYSQTTVLYHLNPEYRKRQQAYARRYIKGYMKRRRAVNGVFRRRQLDMQYDKCPVCGGRKMKRSVYCAKCRRKVQREAKRD